MKNRFFVCVIILATTLLSFAHPTKNLDGYEGYHQFAEGAECRLLADNVNIRESASKTATVLVNIPIGTEVTIVENTNEEMTMNGFTCTWYKVTFKHEGTKKEGYVWGGLIADGWGVSEKDPDVLFLYGVASCKKEKEPSYREYVLKLQMRACKNNKEVSKIEFEAAGDLKIWHAISTTTGRGIAGINTIIQFEESQQMCAGINGYTIIFWDTQKLIYATMLRPGGDAPMFATDDLIFPEDEGGVKGKIIRDEQVGEYQDTENGEGKEVIESHLRVEYTWTGTTLKKGKVLINKK